MFTWRWINVYIKVCNHKPGTNKNQLEASKWANNERSALADPRFETETRNGHFWSVTIKLLNQSIVLHVFSCFHFVETSITLYFDKTSGTYHSGSRLFASGENYVAWWRILTIKLRQITLHTFRLLSASGKFSVQLIKIHMKRYANLWSGLIRIKMDFRISIKILVQFTSW